MSVTSTKKLIICIDTQRDAEILPQVLQRRVRAIDPDTLRELGDSGWWRCELATEREVVGYAIEHAYTHGGF